MITRSTSFRPRTNGFRFANVFDFSFDFTLPLAGSVDLGDLAFGLCGGMCFASLDYYHASRQIPQHAAPPQQGSELHSYLVQRQLESLSLPIGLLRVLEWMVLSDADVGRRTASKEFPKLRRQVDRGQPAVLALIRQGGASDPTKNHQVVAHAYKYSEATKRAEIRVYDPNHPDQEPFLTLDCPGAASGISARQSSGEPLRAFFVMDYRFHQPPSS